MCRKLRPSMMQHLLRRLVFDVPLLNEHTKMPLKVRHILQVYRCVLKVTWAQTFTKSQRRFSTPTWHCDDGSIKEKCIWYFLTTTHKTYLYSHIIDGIYISINNTIILFSFAPASLISDVLKHLIWVNLCHLLHCLIEHGSIRLIQVLLTSPSCWPITTSVVGSITAWRGAGAASERHQMKSSTSPGNSSGESLMLCLSRWGSRSGLFLNRLVSDTKQRKPCWHPYDIIRVIFQTWQKSFSYTDDITTLHSFLNSGHL